MPLRLLYTGRTTLPVEVEGLLPTAVAGKSLAEIERFEILHGNRCLPLAEFFTVSGSGDDCRIDFLGDLSTVHWIGAHLTSGDICIHGNAGRHVGSEMTGGAITVEGNAGDWLGAQMAGGVIRVRGRAGNLVGAAYRGNLRGMTGGTIVVDGPAGNEIGHSMRRGLIAVGAAEDAVGWNMLAGTILVLGPAGSRHGAGMKRGTIGLFNRQPPPLLPSFRHGCRFSPAFLPMLELELRRYSPTISLPRQIELYHGDLLSLGRGEILLPA